MKPPSASGRNPVGESLSSLRVPGLQPVPLHRATIPRDSIEGPVRLEFFRAVLRRIRACRDFLEIDRIHQRMEGA